MSMEKKDEEQLLEAMKVMKNVDWKKVIKVLAKIQQTEGKDDEELNKLLDKWEDVYDDVFKEPLKCSFCNKTQHEVRKLIAGPGVYICDECVELCCEILEEEFKEKHNHGAMKHICNHKRDSDD